MITSSISTWKSLSTDSSTRTICQKRSSKRPGLSTLEMESGCRLGIDSHADTTCAGRHFKITERIEGASYNVSPFSGPSFTNISMVNGVMATDREDGQDGYILEINNALDFTTTMEHSLLCPMQARLNAVQVNDVPTSIDPNSSQSMIFPDGADIPIHYHGPIPYVNVRYPTQDDMDRYPWLSLTADGAWEPYDSSFTIADTQAYPSHTNFDDTPCFYDAIVNSSTISGLRRESRNATVTPEMLAKLWRIPISLARHTLSATTHSSIRSQEGSLSRRFRTDTYQRRYRRLGGPYARFCTDTLFSKVKSVMGNTCAQVYSNRVGFVKLYPMSTKADSHHSFSNFIHEVGIPHSIHSDGAKEEVLGPFRKKLKKYEVHYSSTEPYSPWQNDAERKIGKIKRLGRYLMQSTNTPIRLWDMAYLYASAIISITASNHVDSLHRTPFEHVMGYTPDISEYTSFRWYEWIWYWDPGEMQKQKLGRWCGVANTIGSGHTYFVLTDKGTIIARSSITHLSDDDLESKKELMSSFDITIKELIGTYNKAAYVTGETLDEQQPYLDLIKGATDEFGAEDDTIEFVDQKDGTSNNGIPEADNDEYHEQISKEFGDKYIGMKVLLPNGDALSEAIIQSRKRTVDGTRLVGKENSNPILDTRVYIVSFPDGSQDEYTANMIAESLYSSVDEEGRTHSLIDGIIDHRKSVEAIPKHKAFIEVNGRRKRVHTTKGWDMLVKWKDDSQSWIPLKDVKESNPLETAEYAVSHCIDTEPAFAWWVKHVQRIKSRAISRLRATKQSKHRIRFGIEVPDTIEEALNLDKVNKNDLWRNAIDKELNKVRVAFQLLNEDDQVPVGSKKINYHLIFEVKMDLTRKARLVAGGHLNKNVPRHTTYSSVVSRESVRICFMLAALNNLDVLSGDISNAYLNAKPLEKCHVTITDDILFGPSARGKTAIISRALYGMKSSGNAWRLHFANILDKVMGFTQCFADNDIWFKTAIQPDGTKYYQYVCIYVDDILIVSHKPSEIMSQIGEHFQLKDGSVDSPSMYLGTDIRLRRDEQGFPQYWNLGSNSYLKEALRIVRKVLDESGLKVTGKGVQPYSSLAYRPELDVSPFCNAEQHNLYQGLVGMLRWLIELGRIDVLLETAQLSTYLAAPRIGHLHQAIHIFHYLHKHNSSWIPMDPKKLILEYKGPPDNAPKIRREKMKNIYRDACEDIPDNAPPPRGASVQINVYVDSDHAGNKVTRRSQTGILILLNMAPINWFSKRQNTVESSTFGSELIALKIATEQIMGLRYKLRMMGVPIDGPANVFCDNESVVKSTMNPESTLKKKNVSIAYHKVRECFAAGIIDVYFQYSEDNLADVFTKVLPVVKRKAIFECIFA